MERIGGLDAITHGDPAAPRVLVLVHGRDMTAADLAPFASSLRLADTYVVVPEAPDPSPRGGKTWWAMDTGERPAGGVDLADRMFAGREVARARFARLVRVFTGRDLIVAGFSQGGMLAMDCVLHEAEHDAANDAGNEGSRDGGVSALALLSSSRIDIAAWEERSHRLRGMPVMIAHGRDDPELAFTAGEALRDFAIAAGATVTWLPFDGAHEIPLVVWRGLKRFIGAH